MLKKSLPLLFATLLSSASTNASEGEEDNLITLMGNFQYFMHKTALSLDANNLELVKFYAHEIEETLEEAEDYGSYDGFHIGSMVAQTLAPEFEKFEAFVDKKDLVSADIHFNRMIQSCNTCHQNTEKKFIKIKRIKANLYMQSFDQ
jgi:hypothetical protein